MMEHTHLGVWPETRALLRCLKRSLSQPGESIPITMAGILHAALCRMSEDIERPAERESVRLQVRQVRMYHRVTSRGDVWWHEPEESVVAGAAE